MPTRNISLTQRHDDFIDEVVDAGEYQNASEAVRDALRVLQERRKEAGLKLKALRIQLQAGLEALERGDHVELAVGDLDGFVKAVTPSRKRSR
ncbi:MAG: type II toxin-antitoxin system ParD family antitoxin [Deltaproteobacteria bacterium]|nr:type II toxin-antitoxin system ParD family antitoxin [Deltaproteobacteria bacterium]